MSKRTRGQGRTEATVWIDRHRALIIDRPDDGPERFDLLTRGIFETPAAFEHRAVDEVAGSDRVVVTGPAFARTEFERAYVALTQRPDRIVDVAPSAAPTPTPRRGAIY